jgi:salicylate hydroxylase
MTGGIGYYSANGQLRVSIVDTELDPRNSSYGMHRADLESILADGVPASRLHLKHRVAAVACTDSEALLQFEGGGDAAVDLVIGADGLHSVVRDFVAPEQRATYSGYVAYRGLLDGALFADWPEGRTRLWMGDQKHFLTYGIRRDELINFVAFVPREIGVEESWSKQGDPDRLRAEFAGWDPFVEDLLSRVETTFVWGLYDHEPIVGWGRGRALLIGDAAHAQLPHLGQGINQAVEDAFVLGRMLSKLPSADLPHVSKMFGEYEQVRRQRTDVVQRGSREAGRLYEAAEGSDLEMRDKIVAKGAELRRWLYSFDADPEWHDAGWTS